MIFSIKQGDTKRALKATLEDHNGNAIDLTNVQGINFRVIGVGGSVIMDRSPEILDALNGIVWVPFDSSEISIKGDYKADFTVTHSDGRIESFPSDSYIDFIILPKL